MTAHHESSANSHHARGLGWYCASLLVLGAGMILAARDFPGGYDWSYTVVSALASRRHNPAGSFWFAGALALSMALLWPYLSVLKRGLLLQRPGATKFLIGAVRTGIACGVFVGVERLLIRDISSEWIKGSHELLALITFMALHVGIFGLLIQAAHRQKIYIIPAFIVAVPLIAMIASPIWMALDPRDLGWVGPDWRELGIPLWLSFAFWQWLAMGCLAAGLGLLAFRQ